MIFFVVQLLAGFHAPINNFQPILLQTAVGKLSGSHNTKRKEGRVSTEEGKGGVVMRLIMTKIHYIHIWNCQKYLEIKLLM